MAQSYPTPEPPQPEQPHRAASGPWLVGLILILIGGYLLLRNLGFLPTGLVLHNWWALFILIPAIGTLHRAWLDFRANGHFTGAGRQPLFGGLILLVVACIFLFDLNWSLLWPVLLIVAGIAALAGGLWRD